MMQKKIEISIIEDLKDVAVSLQAIINTQDDMVCEHIFHNAEDAMHFIPNQNADVVIVDIGLPRASGIDAINYLKMKCPHLLFCMFTVYEDDEKIFRSLQAGAKGYILKGASKDKILSSVRELYEGGSPMTPSIARKVLSLMQSQHPKAIENLFQLTQREHEILSLLVEGFSYKMIAARCGISRPTVNTHMTHIYEKLQVHSATEAISKALKNKLF